MFDLNRIQTETPFKSIDFHKQLGSTNDRAIELTRQGKVSGPTLVLTECQTAGRGRGANAWWSPEGTLTFSAVLSREVQSLPAQRVPQLALVAGLAVSESLGEAAPELDLGLKWPNDVYVARQRKISGILIEMPRAKVRTAVIGIGINVNNSFRTAPQDLQQKATSLIDQLGQPQELSEILLRTLQRLTALTDVLCDRPEQILSRWREQCILTGRTACVTFGQSKTRGLCQGVNDHGALVVRTAEGPVACQAGVVSEFQ